MVIKGKVHKFSDDINTDDIIAAKYLVSTDAQELGKHCMETIKPDFSQAVSPGVVLIPYRIIFEGLKTLAPPPPPANRPACTSDLTKASCRWGRSARRRRLLPGHRPWRRRRPAARRSGRPRW